MTPETWAPPPFPVHCANGCRAVIVLPGRMRARLAALTGGSYEDPDRFDGVELDGWVLLYVPAADVAANSAVLGPLPASLLDEHGGAWAAACPKCRDVLLPEYGKRGGKIPVELGKGDRPA